MEPIYQVNPQLDIPIYRQLVDAIRAAVKKGSLQPGQQLPTVQEMSQELSIARGTIKRAYDELERAGLVEKVQGRGTFVCYQPANSGSRKERAMAAIDALLTSLEQMGFSAAEVNIFLNLKLRQWAEQEASVKVAVVENIPEHLSQMTEQLRRIKQVDLYSYSLDSIRQYPYKLSEDVELIVATAENAAILEGILPVRKRVIRVALRLPAQIFAAFMQLPAGATVGVLGYSLPFAELLQRTCQAYAKEVRFAQPDVFSQTLDTAAYLKGLDAVLLPRAYEKFCAAKTAEALEQFGGKRILCGYELDEGSWLGLEEKIERTLEHKSI